MESVKSLEGTLYAALQIVCFAFGCVLLFDLLLEKMEMKRKWVSFIAAYSHDCHMNTSERLILSYSTSFLNLAVKSKTLFYINN